ncbi:MAG: hypothetical protein IJ064_02465 [Bacteroidaceae bacterium]|nr:hypothetical protein [Bacteroidaceae bacterium]
MKKLFLLLLLTGFALTTKAKSDYHPFIEEGKVWHCTIEGEALWILHDSTAIHYTDYALQGDTVIAGKSCKVLSGYFIYEENKKVYAYGRGDDKFHLIYDFGCSVGDVIEVGMTEYLDTKESCEAVYTCTITKVDTIFTQTGDRLRRIHFQTSYDGGEYLWIEGVGAPFEPVCNFGYYSMAGSWSYVSSCSVGGSTFFVYDDIFNTDGVRTVDATDGEAGKRNTPHSYYDLSGRPLHARPARGIYVRNGRKVLVK